MSDPGFIYILTNDSMPGLVKIGKTSRLPEQRSSELFTTGVPTPFAVRFALYVEDAGEIESIVHELLAGSRVNEQREFFRVDFQDAIKRTLNTYLELHCEHLCTTEVELAFDDGDLYRYSRWCDVHPFSVPQVISEFPREAWEAASVAHAVKLKEKLERLKSSSSTDAF